MMSSMFDFNEDGKTDIGEQFIGYQVYRDVTGDDSQGNNYSSPRPGWARKMDGFTIFCIVLIVWQVLNWIADLLY